MYEGKKEYMYVVSILSSVEENTGTLRKHFSKFNYFNAAS